MCTDRTSRWASIMCVPARCEHVTSVSWLLSMLLTRLLQRGLPSQMVINEISDAAPTALQAVKLLALYLSGQQSAVR